MKITEAEVTNGTIWKMQRYHWTAMAQWIYADQWILLGSPDAARHGGTCMIACALTSSEPVIKTKAQLVEVLNRENAVRVHEGVLFYALCLDSPLEPE